MPRKRNEKYEDIYGLIFFIEMTYFYMLDKYGDIYNVSGDEDEIKKLNLNLNEVYKIEGLIFNGKDKRNYLLYRIKKKTKFIKLIDTDANIFKKYAIIRFIFLDDNTNQRSAIIKIRNQKIYIYPKK